MTPIEIAYACATVGVILTVASNLMRGMIPLRMLALASNVAFVVQNVLVHDRVNLTLQALLFVVNAYRLWDLRRLIVAIENAHTDTPLKDWLLPYMKRKKFKAGQTLFAKGDRADHMVYIHAGAVSLPEYGQSLGPGTLIGEIGLFTEERLRTATVICETPCVCYTMTDEAIHLLYFQNPKLGFYLVRLIVQRLLQDLQRRPVTAGA